MCVSKPTSPNICSVLQYSAVCCIMLHCVVQKCEGAALLCLGRSPHCGVHRHLRGGSMMSMSKSNVLQHTTHIRDCGFGIVQLSKPRPKNFLGAGYTLYIGHRHRVPHTHTIHIVHTQWYILHCMPQTKWYATNTHGTHCTNT